MRLLRGFASKGVQAHVGAHSLTGVMAMAAGGAVAALGVLTLGPATSSSQHVPASAARVTLQSSSAASPVSCVSTVLDECQEAVAYASTHHPGSGQARVVAVEADTETHGGSVAHRVYDVRVLAPNGTTYVEHVLRNEAKDSVWWESVAEGQQAGSPAGTTPPAGTTSGNAGATGGANGSPEKQAPENQAPEKQAPEKQAPEKQAPENQAPENQAPEGSGKPVGISRQTIAPQITTSEASASATSFVQSQFPGAQVTGVKDVKSTAQNGKVYDKVKLLVSQGGSSPRTTNVWVDATSSAATVTAVEGGGLSYSDTSLISSTSADQAALAALGGGTVSGTSLHSGKWSYYQVKVVMANGAKEKVRLSAATAVVTQVKAS